MIRIRWALWLLIIIQGVAVFWLMQPWATGDSFAYLRDAESMKQFRFGEWTTAGFVPDGIHPPGYPFFLFILMHLLHLPLGAVVFLQLLMFFAAVRLCEAMLRDALPQVVFLTLVLSYPAAVAYSTRALSEGPALLTLVAAVYLLARNEPGIRNAAVAGGLLGFLALLRPDAALLPPMVALFARSRRSAVVLLGAAGLVLAPYAVRNAVVFSNALPIPPQGALPYSVYLATWEHKLDAADFAAIQRGETPPAAVSSGFAAEAARLNAIIGAAANTPPLGPGAYPAELRPKAAATLRRAAWERIAREPWVYAKHSLVAVWRLFNAQSVPGPRLVALALRVVAGVVWAFGLVGAVLLWRDQRLRLLVVPIVYVLGIHVWLHTEARYTAMVRLFLLACATQAMLLVARTAFPSFGDAAPRMKLKQMEAGSAR